MVVENHCLLSGIDIVPYSVNQSLKLCRMQMGWAYTMVQHVGLSIVYQINVRKYRRGNQNNVYMTWALLQTTGGKDESSIVFMRKS